MTDRATLRDALDGVDVVFHEAAFGGYMPEIAKYVHVNSYGTALLLETIRDESLPVKKVLVASSQVVYSEGAVLCPEHGAAVPADPASCAASARRLERPLPGMRRPDGTHATPEERRSSAPTSRTS